MLRLLQCAYAARTWHSRHCFYEPLVLGRNLFSVWVMLEVYMKIVFFWAAQCLVRELMRVHAAVYGDCRGDFHFLREGGLGS